MIAQTPDSGREAMADTSGPLGLSRGNLPGLVATPALLSHLTPAIDSISEETGRAPAAKSLKGEIIVGKDLMVV